MEMLRPYEVQLEGYSMRSNVEPCGIRWVDWGLPVPTNGLSIGNGTDRIEKMSVVHRVVDLKVCHEWVRPILVFIVTVDNITPF